jgi:protocatechuate 3,4-dioxygenase alpha subunit
MTGLTPFQTAGPFLSVGMPEDFGASVPPPEANRISMSGRLLDGAGAGVPDGVLEFWQPDLRAFHRVLTGRDGEYHLQAVRSKYMCVVVLGRGILTVRYTRIYLDAMDDDQVLRIVPADRRSTLMARPSGDGRYHFDVILQGENETVFFDV